MASCEVPFNASSQSCWRAQRATLRRSFTPSQHRRLRSRSPRVQAPGRTAGASVGPAGQKSQPSRRVYVENDVEKGAHLLHHVVLHTPDGLVLRDSKVRQEAMVSNERRVAAAETAVESGASQVKICDDKKIDVSHICDSHLSRWMFTAHSNRFRSAWPVPTYFAYGQERNGRGDKRDFVRH